MTVEPDRTFLDNYHCTKCGYEVSLHDGLWECECYEIGAYELDCGYHEIPKFWEQKAEGLND